MSASDTPTWMVPVLSKLEPIDRLPLWAKVVVCERIVRRAAMALLSRGHDADTDSAHVCLAGCDLAMRCATAGTVHPAWRDEFRRMTDLAQSPGAPAPLVAMRWLLDAALGAQLETELGTASGTVSRSLWSAVAALGRDPRVPQMQVLILMGADADQLAFACHEAGVAMDGPMGPAVMGRMAPVHALTLIDVRPTPEELAR